ncbi:MAG: hypothetical protein P8M34_05255 [Saprospiraceae bacterium]|nr:hypothetical protein [Saprospiraceae bacterium]|tara:strand:+ start:4355 stop:5731 length:1377 start_codon:yes stop_codon:yes gene_type:complete
MNRNASAAFVVFLITIAIFYISKDFILFWDTIQFAGHHPQYYYDSGFSSLFLPNKLDSGHIPIFGMYIAWVWKIIGKSLWSSHLAMMPFVFLCLWHAYLLGLKWIPSKAWLFPLVIICMPQSVSQFMLVSPDVVLLCFFLGLFLSLEEEKKNWVIAHSIGLVLISNRGFILLGAFMLWSFLKSWNTKNRFKTIALFIPAIIVFSGYQLLHWFHISWVGTHSEMPWSMSFSIIGFETIFKNILVYGWRLMDFGAVIIWIIMVYYIYKKPRSLMTSRSFQLLVIMILLFGIVTIPFSGLMQHRYFIPIQVLAGFILLKWILSYEMYGKRSRVLIGSTLLFLILGNGWIYPDRIAQGWDSTLAHLPYYSMQNRVTTYLNENKIDKEEVATAFPLRSPQSILNANDDSSQFHNKDESETDYILYSNVMNDFSDKEVEILKYQWIAVKAWRSFEVKMILYKRS